MAGFTDIYIQRPVLASVVSLLIFLLGLKALTGLPLRQFPEMKNTVITVSTSYAGANPELMQGFITYPLQKSIASADGIDYLTAQSTAGFSQIKAYIKLNFDPDKAMTGIMAKVAEVRDQLPRESDQPVIVKDTGSQFALLYIGFNSKDMTTQQITDYLSRVIRPKLQTVSGVADAQILGGQTYAMRIWLNIEKMASLNITPTEVISTLQAQNYQTAAGQIKGKFVLFDINAHTNLSDAEQFKNIVIRNNNGTLLRLKDIATVDLGAESYDFSLTFDGKNAVFIGIKGTPSSNPLTVIDGVKKIMPEIESNYPSGFKSTMVYDSTEYIRSSIHEVISSIVEASVIVIIVVFLFLGSLRTVTIPVVTIPLSLVGVSTLMYAMGYSINTLTLLAMVLAIGLVVDDAIVVVENIYRHIEEGLSPFDAAIKGAREIATPVISMTTTLAAVYAPIGFMTGLTGALFKEFAFTLAFSVILSGVFALTLSPMMCSKVLSHSLSQERFVQIVDRIFEKVRSQYEMHLSNVLNFRPVTVVFAAIILVACVLLAVTTTSELAPEEDQNAVFVSANAPQYANVDYLEKYTNQLNNIYRSFPETQDFFIVNGEGGPTNAFSIMILKPWDKRKRSQSVVQEKLQDKISKIAGIETFAFAQSPIPGVSEIPIQFVITTTDDYPVINQIMQKLLTAANNSGLFLFAFSDLKIEKPEVELTVNRDKAASVGVTMQTIGTALASLLNEGSINRFSIEGHSYKVIPQADRQFRLNPRKLDNVYIPADNNVLIPLSTIVDYHVDVKPNALNQFQQLNSATLQAVMIPGKTITQGLTYLQDQAKKIFPTGVSYDYAGQSRQVIQEGSGMVFTFFFAIIIIYLVLSAQFESFRDPFIVLISVPMSIAGALIPLNIGLATLNIYTGIGLITLIGLISKHGILMVEFANQLQESENLTIYQAIIKSATLRLRPILMTTAAMIFGVVPLILASGAGAKSRFDIGLVIAAGMLVGTCFTLFVVPTVYTFLAKDHRAHIS